ncbi:MAG: hypothetical protein NUV59_00815 [Patescibacteria group bacterium]|nr:hypothetical protein [Patescibacteria group bacterium]
MLDMEHQEWLKDEQVRKEAAREKNRTPAPTKDDDDERRNRKKKKEEEAKEKTERDESNHFRGIY